MAGDWIKLEHATPDKPEVFRMAAILNIDPDAVMGKLVRFWAWCDQQSVDGNALGVSEATIDRVTHQPGFSVALRDVAWLQARSGSLAIPHFDRHNGQTAKARAETNRRVARHRGNGNSVTDVTRTPLQKPLPEKRREEKKEETTSPPAESGGTQSEIVLQHPGAGHAFVTWFVALLVETGAPAPKLTPSNRDSWAKCYDDMLRIDGRTKEQVKAVCSWARNDSFWRKNFLSPMKLRERKDGVQWFDAFSAKMNPTAGIVRDYSKAI
jgi:hypothetical protein